MPCGKARKTRSSRRRFRAVGFILGVDLVAEADPAGIEDDTDMVGIGLVQQLQQHVGEAEHGVDVRAVRPGQRWQCVEGPEDVAGAVDEEEMIALFHGQTGSAGRRGCPS